MIVIGNRRHMNIVGQPDMCALPKRIKRNPLFRIHNSATNPVIGRLLCLRVIARLLYRDRAKQWLSERRGRLVPGLNQIGVGSRELRASLSGEWRLRDLVW